MVERLREENSVDVDSRMSEFSSVVLQSKDEKLALLFLFLNGWEKQLIAVTHKFFTNDKLKAMTEDLGLDSRIFDENLNNYANFIHIYSYAHSVGTADKISKYIEDHFDAKAEVDTLDSSIDASATPNNNPVRIIESSLKSIRGKIDGFSEMDVGGRLLHAFKALSRVVLPGYTEIAYNDEGPQGISNLVLVMDLLVNSATAANPTPESMALRAAYVAAGPVLANSMRNLFS